MSSKSSKRKSSVVHGVADNYFVSNVEEPFDEFVGKEFVLLGSWWPDCAQKDRFTEFKMIVLGVEREWKANDKASPRVAFKVGLFTMMILILLAQEKSLV
jgi:hypothetical protein